MTELHPEGRSWTNRGGWVVMASLGVVLAILPHPLAFWQTGEADYFADGDALLYHAWLREAVFRGKPWMVDGIHDGHPPMMHPWLLYLPLALLSHALDAGMLGLGLILRVAAGLGLGVGLLAAVRSRVSRPGLSLGLALALLFDSGFLFGQVVQRPIEVLIGLTGPDFSLLRTVPVLMPHLRVATPSLVVALMLLHHAAVLRAVERHRAGQNHARNLAIGLGMVTLALLVHAYFYLWTMLVLGGGLAFLLDRRGRPVYLSVVAGGLLLGMPFLVESYRIKASTSPDWLLRTAKFVPIPRFSELLFPKILIAEWALAGLWVWTRRRDLAYLWCATAAGLLLLNHQVVTGLQIENDHWTLTYGSTFSVLLALIVAPGLARLIDRPGRFGSVGLLALLVVQVGVGYLLRGVESTRSQETRRVNGRARDSRAAHWRIPPGAVVAGDPDLLFAGAAQSLIRPLSCRLVEFSSAATDRELDERLFLNLCLQGVAKAEAIRLADAPPGTLSWEAQAVRDREVAERQRQRRHELIDRIWSDPAAWAGRYGVTYLLRRLDRLAPPPGGIRLSEEQSALGYRLDRVE